LNTSGNKSKAFKQRSFALLLLLLDAWLEPLLQRQAGKRITDTQQQREAQAQQIGRAAAAAAAASDPG
jgi:hypothetical protein